MRGDCLPYLSPVTPRSTGGYLVPEFERRIDYCAAARSDTGPANGDVSIIKHPSENRLIDIDAFNLVHVHLNGMSADEAPLIDDAAVGHVDFRGPAFEPGGESQSRAYQHANERHRYRDRPGGTTHRNPVSPGCRI